jgi:hypothetical protein
MPVSSDLPKTPHERLVPAWYFIILFSSKFECVFQGIGEMLRSLSSGLMAPGGGAGNNQPSANVTIIFISIVLFCSIM